MLRLSDFAGRVLREDDLDDLALLLQLMVQREETGIEILDLPATAIFRRPRLPPRQKGPNSLDVLREVRELPLVDRFGEFLQLDFLQPYRYDIVWFRLALEFLLADFEPRTCLIVVVVPSATSAARCLWHLVEPEHGIVFGDVTHGLAAKANELLQVTSKP